jgi:uncharacterized delta-60 repeat protein
MKILLKKKLVVLFVPFILIAICIFAGFKIADAHTSINSSQTTPCGSLDSTDLATHMYNQIYNRTNGLSTTTSLSILTTRGDSVDGYGATTTPFVRNVGSWTESGTPLDFTGFSLWTQMYNGYSSRSQHIATLISPRHFVTAHHWGITDGGTVAFVASDNTIVYRTVVSTVQIGTTDIQVGILDSDVPDTITYYPIVASSTLQYAFSAFGNEDINVPMVFTSIYDNNFGIQKLASLASNIVGAPAYSTAPFAEFAGSHISGSSGSPLFIVIDNQPVVLSTAYTLSSGPQLGAYIPEINAAMTALGGSYQVTQYTLPCFNTYTPNNKPTISRTYPIATPTVLNPVSSTTDPVVTFTESDYQGEGQTHTFSIDSLTGSGTSTPLNWSNLFTISTTSTSITLYQKINIDPAVYGSTLTAVVSVSDNVVGHTGVASTTVTIAVRNVQTGANYGYDAGPGSISLNNTANGVLSDGNKIVFVGGFSKINGSTSSVARIDQNGQLDSTFNGGEGTSILESPSSIVGVHALVKENSGSYLFGARVGKIASINTTALATTTLITRINSDGSVDSSFAPIFDSAAVSIGDILPFGTDIFVYGKFFGIGGYPIYRFAKLKYDGTLDPTFAANYSANGTAGLTTGSFGIGTIGNGNLVTDGSNIYIGGYIQNYVNSSGATTTVGNIVKFDSDGHFDYAFAANSGTGFNGPITRMRIRPDGKLVVLGNFVTYNGTSTIRVALLNQDGTLDMTFKNNSGTGLVSGFNDGNAGLVVQPDNKIIIGTTNVTSYNGTSTSQIIRLNADGTLDKTFTDHIGLGLSSGQVVNLALTSDGSLIIGGTVQKFNNISLSAFGVTLLKTKTPDAPAVAAVDGHVYSSTLNIATSTVLFSGTGSSTATVRIFDGSSEIASTTVNDTGSWSVTPTIAQGTHAIGVVQSLDVFGRVDSATTSISLTVDTAAPADPVITSPTNGQYVGTNMVVSGTCEAGATMEFSSNLLIPNTSTSTCSGGTFSTTLNWSLSALDTIQSFSVTQTDAAGNTSGAASLSAVHIVSVENPPEPFTRLTGNTELSPSFSVACISGNTAYVYEGNTVIGSALCTSNPMTVRVSSPLSAGNHKVISVQENIAGLSSASAVVDFTLTSPAVASSGGGGGGGGFSGGGGSSPMVYYTNNTVKSNPIAVPTIANTQSSIASIVSGLSVQKSRNLTVSSKGNDVLLLQKYLNKTGFTIAKSGSGSVGKESNYFGIKTKAALAKFQKAKGIKPSNGVFGPKTRAYILGH